MPVDKDWEIACITRQVMYQPPERRYAILFENVTGYQTPVATNTLGASRELYATAIGAVSSNGQVDKEAIHAKWVRALAAPVEPIIVKTGPCKENIMRGDDIDLLKFPIPTWTPGQRCGRLSLGRRGDSERSGDRHPERRRLSRHDQGAEADRRSRAARQAFRRDFPEVRGRQQTDAGRDRDRPAALSRHDLGRSRSLRRRRDRPLPARSRGERWRWSSARPWTSWCPPIRKW